MQTLLRSSLLLAAALSPVAKGEKLLMSKSLNTCQEESGFSASLFDVIYTPENNSARINLDALSTIQGKVVIDLAVSVYGYPVFSTVIDPCKAQKEVKLEGLCPMVPGPIKSPFALTVPADTAKQIPGIAYTIPDLDAKVRVLVNLTSTAESIACVEASISNGKTVDLPGVKAATVAIAGLAQIASVVLGALGHSNAAAHVASNSLSLFGYFQAVAIVGLTGVRLPPIVEAWTMNFQWSMGIIRGVHTQDFLTWYQRSTGGTPAKILSSLSNLSVQVAKRSLETASDVVRSPMVPRTPVPAPAAVTSISSTAGLFRRGNIMTGSGSYVVYGLQRVAFKSKIETTNLFMTGLIFFCSLMAAAAFIVMVSKGICELCAKKKWCGKFSSFRHDWLTILKGSLAKVALVLFPQITILCLWEFTQADSPAELVLAVFFLLGPILILAWGAFQVIRLARHSTKTYQNAAYLLFSDPNFLHKWGFLYIPFRASACYIIAPILVYIIAKAFLIAFAQSTGIVQAIGLIILEAAAVISASVLRPWMDKTTNSFNIAIYAVNFINAIFLFIFSNVLGTPSLVVGVIGLVLFIFNAAFSLIMLFLLLISTAVTMFRNNPDARYHVMADDRTSFVKSQTHLAVATELDALSTAARGGKVDDERPSDREESPRPTPGVYRTRPGPDGMHF